MSIFVKILVNVLIDWIAQWGPKVLAWVVRWLRRWANEHEERWDYIEARFAYRNSKWRLTRAGAVVRRDSHLG